MKIFVNMSLRGSRIMKNLNLYFENILKYDKQICKYIFEEKNITECNFTLGIDKNSAF